MVEHIESLQHLAEQFGRLQGIGRKTAMRMAFSVLRLAPEEAEEFANAILEAKQSIHECPICGNLTDKEICSVCDDDTRDKRLICVVEDVKAVMSIEKVREFRGVYHVLGGVISPINGITPDRYDLPSLSRESVRRTCARSSWRPTPHPTERLRQCISLST
jgi:recombination protein RecR